jgi:aspartyl-tRNA(Asn)/glutamyl-tRNA(Gln) amidotransferase subunit C
MAKVDIRKITHLARIGLTEAEADKLQKDFIDILEHIKKIDEVDLTDVEPVSHPFNIKNVFREDEIDVWMSREDLIQLAPAKDRSMVKVPKVIEGKS